MSNFQVFTDNYNAKETLSNLIAPPVAGGTIDLVCVDGGVVQGNTSSAETWYLPDEDNVPVQTTVYVSNKSTGTLTIKRLIGSTLDTVTSGEIKGFILSSSRSWRVLADVPDVLAATSVATTTGQIYGLTIGAEVLASSGLTSTDSGSVTQTGSATDAVAIVASSGTITTVSQTLGIGLEVSFDVTNASLVGNEVVCVSPKYNGSTGLPLVAVTDQADGSFTLTITNLHASGALNGTLAINYFIIKQE
jgi:hypothetical protein